jgi:hypothetical protein
MSAPLGWRVGDAGHTVFGPNLGKPSPEVIATGIKPDNARFIVKACNSHAALVEALWICEQLITREDSGSGWHLNMAAMSIDDAGKVRAALKAAQS